MSQHLLVRLLPASRRDTENVLHIMDAEEEKVEYGIEIDDIET